MKIKESLWIVKTIVQKYFTYLADLEIRDRF